MVEPEDIDCELELTEQVKQSIAGRTPEIVHTVLEEIEDAIHTK